MDVIGKTKKTMTIGIASPISTGSFSEYLFDEDKKLCERLSKELAPAVTTLSKEFLSAGHNLIIFTLDPKANEDFILRGPNLTIYVKPQLSKSRLKRLIDPFIAKNIRVLRGLFRKHQDQLDVLSVHWTRDYAVASKVLIGKVPVFVTVRDIIPYILKTQKFSWRMYNWWLIYLMNEWVMHQDCFRFIANSEYTARSVNNYWGKKVPVISNPIQDKYFEIENKSQKIQDKFNITSISISQPDDSRKNVLGLLRAFQVVRSKRKNVYLNLIGQSFVSDNPIIKHFEDCGLLDGVNMLGSLSHEKVLDVLSQSHLMVHPSLEETFGNTLIEAMAAGCPVIGGINSGAVPFVLDNGKAGFLCDVTSTESLAQTMIEVIDSPEEREKKKVYAKEYCQKNFSSHNIAQEYIRLFHSASKK